MILKSFKRNIAAGCLCLFMTAVLLTGCGGLYIVRPESPETGRRVEPIPEQERSESGEYTPSYMDSIGNAQFPSSYGLEDDWGGSDDYDVESKEDSSGIDSLVYFTPEQLQVGYTNNAGKYAYEHLTEEGRKVYNQMYLALITMSSNIGIDCFDVDAINMIFTCVMMDHPEIFWTSGYVYTRYTRGESMEAMGFKGTYTMDANTVGQRQDAIDYYVSAALSGMPGGDDYTRIKYIYEYIIKNTEYDLNAVDNQNICSVFINGRSVCQGYAKATQYLCERAGIQCSLITGTTTQDGNHAWNLVYSDGEYYYVDTTWGDANYRSENEEAGSMPSISYDYLCVPAYEMFLTHYPNAPVELPACDSIADNYYVREGAYFTYPDEAGLQAVFDKAYAQGKEFVAIKTSDAVSYQSVKAYLLDNQNIFRIMGSRKSGNTISFWENQDAFTISFKLDN